MRELLRAPLLRCLVFVMASYLIAIWLVPIDLLHLFEDAYRVVIAVAIGIYLWPDFRESLLHPDPTRGDRMLVAVSLLVAPVGAVSAWRIVAFWFDQPWLLNTWQFGLMIVVLIYAMTLVLTTKNGAGHERRVSSGARLIIIAALVGSLVFAGLIWSAYWMAGRI